MNTKMTFDQVENLISKAIMLAKANKEIAEFKGRESYYEWPVFRTISETLKKREGCIADFEAARPKNQFLFSREELEGAIVVGHGRSGHQSSENWTTVKIGTTTFSDGNFMNLPYIKVA